MILGPSESPIRRAAVALATPALHRDLARQSVMHALRFGRTPSDHLTGANGKPVALLIKGFGAGQASWATAAEVLREEGCDYAYAPDFDSTGDVEVAAERLMEKLDGPLRGRRVIPIGHSMGGLVTYAALRRAAPGLREQLVRVVTLSAPFRGAPLARLLVPLARWLGRERGRLTACLQMEPDSPYLDALETVDVGETPIDCYSAGRDVVVPPESHARRNRGWNERVISCPDLHHHSYLTGREGREFFRGRIVPLLRAA